jgi:hypothetical protein
VETKREVKGRRTNKRQAVTQHPWERFKRGELLEDGELHTENVASRERKGEGRQEKKK